MFCQPVKADLKTPQGRQAFAEQVMQIGIAFLYQRTPPGGHASYVSPPQIQYLVHDDESGWTHILLSFTAVFNFPHAIDELPNEVLEKIAKASQADVEIHVHEKESS